MNKAQITTVALALAGTAAAGLGLVAIDERMERGHSGGPTATPPAPADTAPAAQAAVTAGADFAASPAPAPTTGPKPAAPTPTPAPTDDALVIKRVLPIDGPIKYGEWHWDDAGVPQGPIIITVDLDARVLSVFKSGYEIGATAVLLGTQEKPTPTGVFPITEKQVKHFSTIYDSAPMPYMQRLTNDGVTIHATTVENGYASHGCVGVPLDFARKLFGVTHVGDKVIITKGKQTGVGKPL